jgi:hypothetical protein
MSAADLMHLDLIGAEETIARLERERAELRDALEVATHDLRELRTRVDAVRAAAWDASRARVDMFLRGAQPGLRWALKVIDGEVVPPDPER